MDTGLGDNVHVEAVAQVDRVDVVAFQVRVHDREEDLQEEVDCVKQNREEEEPAIVLAGARERLRIACDQRHSTMLLQSFWRW